MRILIIDDDQHQLQLFAMSYGLGHDVITVNGARDAMDLDWRKFDLVIVDLLMGKTGGDDLIRWAARQWRAEDLPRMVLYSAVSAEQQKRICGYMPDGVRIAQKAMPGSLRDQLLSFVV